MRGKLLVDAGGQGSSRVAKPPGVQFEHDGHEEAAFAKLHPFEMADMVFRISFRQPTASTVTLAKILDDRTTFRHLQTIIFDQRRLAQGVDLLEFGRGEVGFGIALIRHDVVISVKFLQQPQDALRTAVVEMVDGDCHAALLSCDSHLH